MENYYAELRQHLDHSELVRTNYHSRKFFSQRRRPIPEWVMNSEILREVITRMVEARAIGCRIKTETEGTHRERIARAEKKIAANKQDLIEAIRRLMREEMHWRPPWDLIGDEDAGRRVRALRKEIENIDTQLRMANRCAALYAAVIFLYYRVGLTSVEIGQEIGLKPPHVRQIVYRADRFVEKILEQRRNKRVASST